MQIAGLLDAAQHNGDLETIPKTKPVGQVYLEIGATTDPDLAATAAEARQLLGIKPGVSRAEVVYGVGARASGQISILTRPMLSILSQLAIQVDVPAADIADGDTTPSVGNIGIEHGPVVVIHSGSKAPHHALVAIRYHQTWFWISDSEFNSKVAFSIVQILLALTQTTNASGAVITIPAG